MIADHRVSCAVIIDEDGRLQGLITQACILQMLAPNHWQKVFEGLQQEIQWLEAEKLERLQKHNQALEKQVAQRTAEIGERTERENFLANLARQFSQSPDLIAMLTSAVSEVKQFLECDRVIVYQFQAQLQGTVIAEAVAPAWSSVLGSHYQDICFPKWLAADYLDGRQRIVDDIYQANLSDCHITFLESLQIKGYLIVPIVTGNQLWGLLAAHCCVAPRPWQRLNLDLLDRLGTQLAIAIQHNHLYQQTQIEIQERQQAEWSLQQERNFANAILNAAGAMVVVSDQDGRIVRFNQTCQHVSGYTLDEVKGRRVWEFLVPPNEATLVEALITEVLQGESQGTSENYWVTKTGEHRLIAWTNSRLLDANGKIEHIIGTGIDVTEARQAEAALRKSEATNRVLLDTIPDLMIRMRRDGIYLDFLPARDGKVDIPFAKMQGRSIFEAMPAAIVEEHMTHVQLALETKTTQIYEYQVEIAGQITYEEARIAVCGEEEVLLIIRDISERKRAEAKRQQVEAVLHSLVEGTAAVVGDNFFEALVLHISSSLDVRHAMVAAYSGKQGRTLAFCSDGQLQDNICYELDDLPGEVDLQQPFYCCPSKLPAHFPAKHLVDSEVRSYLGIALLNSTGQPIGTLSIFDTKPIANCPQVANILKIFAARAAAELERQQTIDALHQLNQELEARVIMRTEELSDSNIALLESNVALLKSQEQLRRSEELLQLTIDNAPIGIVTATLDGQLRTVNHAFCTMLGYSPEEMLNQTFIHLTHPDDRPASLLEIQRLVAGELPMAEMEKRYLHKDGFTVDAIVRVGIVRDMAELPLQFVAEIEDIRERKRTEAERKRAEAEIRKALEAERELNELKSRFVSMTSHEFRTPLGVIASSAGIIQDYGDRLDETKKQKHLKRIQDSVIHMTQLLEDVLTLSRAEAGKLQLKLTPLAIYAFCQEIAEDLNISHGSSRIKIQMEASCPKTVMVDKRLLRQILTNLLSNALKYSFPDSDVCLQIACQTRSFALIVQDRGIGIPLEDMKHLFQSFHRAKNVGNIPGTGLGLSIVKRLVELHQGKITCHSEINVGTTFTVRFPLGLIDTQ